MDVTSNDQQALAPLALRYAGGEALLMVDG